MASSSHFLRALARRSGFISVLKNNANTCQILPDFSAKKLSPKPWISGNIGSSLFLTFQSSHFSSVVAEQDSPALSPQILDKNAFMSKPCSLALPADSSLYVKEPEHKGLKRLFLKMMLYYGKESTKIRRANVLYRRVVSQVENPEIYDAFCLEKCFRTTFALLILHMWFILSRLKREGKEGVEFGQCLYEIYSYDLEMRVAAAGVNLLLSKYMKDTEKIFYGNVEKLDAAMKPEAEKNEMRRVLWKNVFSGDDAPMPEGLLASPMQALERYTRREYACMALTEKEALFSGNLMFTSVNSTSAQTSDSDIIF